ncbi:3'-5' exonuclease [Flavobacterium tegetincola]|uniref:3'-5' exonuclease n=1 Tax=Flavobacterium tegetincola TaxID=150172 RepID=UPI0004144568|nr:3'-5' exonuclease [Flavobacterium tegetincola]
MLDWLKNKKYPEFWKSYLQKQEEDSNRYVTLSLKTTGLNTQKDIILTIGCVAIHNNEIVIKDAFEVILLQYIYNHDHGFSNDFIIESKMAKVTEAEGMERLVNYLQNAVIIGHRVDLDLEMINKALEKLECGRLKNEALDLEIMFRKWKEMSDDKKLSVEEIAQALKLPYEDYDSTIQESYTMALCFLKLKKYLRIE